MIRRGRSLSTFFLGVLFFAAGCSGAGRLEARELTAAQRFTLNAASDGKPVSLDALLAGHKAVLVNFWATWCPPCREEIPDLIRLQKQYGDKGFTIVGVDVGESAKRVSAFGAKMGMNYPLLLDPENAAAESYKVVGIPTSLLIDKNGKVLEEYHAATPKLFSDVEKALR
jgi:thiol-disulfide isomerase/thioredoxin